MTQSLATLKTAALFLLACTLVTGCKKPAPEAEKPEVVVQAEKPAIGAITEDISADAVLTPIAQAAIMPKITAPVRAFYVQRGARVKAGQLLATLENSDLAAAATDNQGAYDAARGTYATATASTVPEEQTKARLDVQEARATLDLDQTILKSRQQLLAQGAIPGRDVDTAQATVIQAQGAFEIAQQHLQGVLKTDTRASLEIAKGTLQSARGKYLEAEAQLSYTSVRSPIAGVVTDRPFFAGETAPAGTALITVMDTSFMIAKLHIAQVQAQQLQLGASATMTVPGMDGLIAARVSLVSPALDPGSTTVEVWLKAANPAGKLKAGTAVHVSIEGRQNLNAMLIPTEAVQRSTEGAGKIVHIIGPDGKTLKRDITTGIETKESTQILTGLGAGDMVITNGGYGLDDGTKVRVGPAETKDDDEKGGKE